MAVASIVPRYCEQPPSLQTSLDVFRGLWKAALPPELGLVAGSNPIFFQDPGVHWAATLLPGGFQGLDILELGPFEGYDTYLFERFGARHVTSVEANNINFLKCLVVKDVLNLRAKLCHGDIRGFLRNADRKFDLIWASGVLYHSDDPLDLLHLAACRSDRIFIWTHYYLESLLTTSHAALFPADGRISVAVNGRTYCLHRHHYFSPGDDRTRSLNWEGGTQLHSYWLEREGILGFLRDRGFSRISIHDEGHLDQMPFLGFLAERAG